jgi:hypothetical protein
MMPGLCLITVPGLDVRTEWRILHDRLLDEFPQVSDVLATTMQETILIVYDEATGADSSRWLDTVSETLRWRDHDRDSASPTLLRTLLPTLLRLRSRWRAGAERRRLGLRR